MNLIKKLSVAGVSAAIALSAYAPSVFAGDVTCKIKGNGAHSHNHCKVKMVKVGPVVLQGNYATVGTVVTAVSGTGGNKIKDGTTGDGDMSVETGNSTVTVTVTNGPINTNVNGSVNP